MKQENAIIKWGFTSHGTWQHGVNELINGTWQHGVNELIKWGFTSHGTWQ
jgi:hypothetical protein